MDLHPLDLPWAEERDPLIDDGTYCITDCYGLRVAVGLRQIDAAAIVERMPIRFTPTDTSASVSFIGATAPSKRGR